MLVWWPYKDVVVLGMNVTFSWAFNERVQLDLCDFAVLLLRVEGCLIEN